MAETRGRKRLSSVARRELILVAAEEEFARAGYDGAAMDRIALAADVTKPVLYDHFPSKLAVFTAVLDRVREKLLRAGAEAEASSADDAERVRAAVLAFFAFAETSPAAMRVLLMAELSASPEARQASQAVQGAATEGIAQLLSGLADRRHPTELRATAEFVKGGLHALARWWLAHPRVSREEMTELGFRLVWSGLKGPEHKV
jgi:AcrR family transcriptional regulator